MNVLEARRRTLGKGVYKKTVKGNPAIAQGSLARRYPGITMQGWTEQNGTPTPEVPVPIVSAGSGGEIGVTVQGGNLVNIPDIPAGDGKLKIKIPADISAPFVVSVDDSDVVIGGAAIWRLKFDFEDGSALHASDKNFPKTINANPENKVVAITYRDERIASGTYRNFMINYGSTPLPYEPYRTPQTVTLTSDRPLTKWDKLEKRNGQWGWVYKSAEIESYTDESVPGEYFSTTGQLSTGAQVWYETTTETFAPLSESEQEQMNDLHTFRPTTVLSNDAGCNMTLTYKTKKSLEVAT